MKLKLLILSIMFMTGCSSCTHPGPNPQPTPTPTPSVSAGLRLHPENPHYFQDIETNKPVLIAAYGNLVPTDRTYDDLKNIANMKSNGMFYGRVWSLLPWGLDNAEWPWLRLAPIKWDLNQWNPEYFNRMHASLDAATKAGITAEVMIFDRVGMSPPAPDRWGNNPWASDNNVNGLETPNKNGDGTPDFYMYATKPNLKSQQEKYVKKLLDETAQYNTIYEIENEHWNYNSSGFADHWAIFVKDYLATKGISKLVSYNSLQSDLEDFYSKPSVDIVNKHYGGEPEANPDILNQYIESSWHFNKAINIDEFANGATDPDIMRQEVWTIVMSGGNYHIEDANDSSLPQKNTQNVINFVKQTGWDFIHSHPKKNYSPGGYCMINEGKEYACYYSNSNPKTINLPAGTYHLSWYDTHNGGINKGVDITTNGGDFTLSPPFPLDWAIHIK